MTITRRLAFLVAALAAGCNGDVKSGAQPGKVSGGGGVSGGAGTTGATA